MKSTGQFLTRELVTLVPLLSNGQVCLERVVTTSEQSGILADWLAANGPYSAWKLQSYKCVSGKYLPKGQVLKHAASASSEGCF
jgi:hypothetical protein